MAISSLRVDLSVDEKQWRCAGPRRSRVADPFLVLLSLMVAEERITTEFTGLVGRTAARRRRPSWRPSRSTRHATCSSTPASRTRSSPPQVIAAHVGTLAASRSPTFAQIFDEALVEAHEQLCRRPGRPGGEGPLRHALPPGHRGHPGLTSFNFITDYLNSVVLPGFVEGFEDPPRRDRHIAYGVWFLRETVAPSRQADMVRATLRPCCRGVAVLSRPPGDGDAGVLLGVTQEEIRESAPSGLSRRLKIIGVPLKTPSDDGARPLRVPPQRQAPADERGPVRARRRRTARGVERRDHASRACSSRGGRDDARARVGSRRQNATEGAHARAGGVQADVVVTMGCGDEDCNYVLGILAKLQVADRAEARPHRPRRRTRRHHHGEHGHVRAFGVAGVSPPACRPTSALGADMGPTDDPVSRCGPGSSVRLRAAPSSGLRLPDGSR